MNPKATKPKLLIVEDDMIIAADVSMQLSKIGYEIIGISTKAEDAIELIENNRPDLILMDIVLGGDMNGIDAAHYIRKHYQVPLVFLTSNTDDATFQEALEAKPFAFIAKPFRRLELERTLRITLLRVKAESLKESEQEDDDNSGDDHYSLMEDRLFILDKEELVKLLLSDILYVSASGNYCNVHTKERTILVSKSLRIFESQLPLDDFVRVHRSYVVNIKQVDSVSKNHEELTIAEQHIPISRRLKDELFLRMKLV